MTALEISTATRARASSI